MVCMKCGREISGDQVFCQECLDVMEKYPVKPGTVVLLPRVSQSQPKPHRRHPVIPPEEQIHILKKRVRGLVLALVLAIAATVGLAYVTVTDYLEDKDVQFLPGQNYSSSTSPDTGKGK